MPREFIITETEVRRWRVILSDGHTSNAKTRGGEQEVELCACDQISDPSPHLGDVVTLLSVKNEVAALAPTSGEDYDPLPDKCLILKTSPERDK